jgi:hypothetical protein
VDAHSVFLYGSGAGDFAGRLLAGEPSAAADPVLRSVSSWAAAAMRRDTSPVSVPYPVDHEPEMWARSSTSSS